MKLQIIEDYKTYRPVNKVLIPLTGLFLLFVLFYHGFIHTGIVKLPAARAQDCSAVVSSRNIEIIMDNSTFTPNDITATVCDKLVFVNREEVLHEPATGPHPTHTSYPGFDSKQPLQKDEQYDFVLNRTGSYSFHDHLNDQMRGKIKINKK